MRASGIGEEEIQTSLADARRIYTVLKSGEDKQTMKETLRGMYEEDMAKLSEEERKEPAASETAFEAEVAQVLDDLQGELNRLSGKALKKGGNGDVTLKEMPGLNHLFQTAETGALSEYGRIEETISPEVLRLVGDWILERFGKK